MEKVVTRPAAKADAPAVARLLMMAWPIESFLAMSPGMTEDMLAEIITGYVEAEDTLYSYRNNIVAVDGGKIAGTICGYDGAMYEVLKRPVLDDFSRRFPSEDSSFGNVTETEAGEFYIDSAGVDPGARGLGIGSMLFKAILEKASGLGFRKAGLIVDIDNPKAEALYLRLGFRHVGYRDFLGHSMKHMQKNLHGIQG